MKLKFNQDFLFTADSVLHIAHTVGVDGEHGLALRKTGTVVDLADSLFSSSLPQIQPADEMIKIVSKLA